MMMARRMRGTDPEDEIKETFRGKRIILIN